MRERERETQKEGEDAGESARVELCACSLLFVTESPLQSQRFRERREEEVVAEVEARGAVHEPSLRNALGCRRRFR